MSIAEAAARHDEQAAENFWASIREVQASLEGPFVALVREMIEAKMTVPQIIRLVLDESEK